MATKFVILACCAFSAANAMKEDASPMAKIVKLLQNLQAGVEKDGANEQKTYNKYACWVEKSLAEKAAAITEGNRVIAESSENIKKLMASIASRNVQVKQFNKNIATNRKSHTDSAAVRHNEHMAYQSTRADSESCIASVEGALTALKAGTAKKGAGFLQQQLRETELMTAAMNVMQNPVAQARLSNEDLVLVKRFADSPKDAAPRGIIAAQIGEGNAGVGLGDYAPASDQIQGIFQNMYETTAIDLERANGEEADALKTFKELQATNGKEYETLKAALASEEKSLASESMELSETKQLRGDTTDQLEADENFFQETKKAAEKKAVEWSERSRMRTEELAGIQGAIEILKGGEKTFKEASTSFVQVKAVTSRSPVADKAYALVQTLAEKHQSSKLKRVGAMLKNAGHFDAVMVEIDNMMRICRNEEQDDIEHRDSCEKRMSANANDISDNTDTITNTDRKLKRMANADSELERSLRANKGSIEQSHKSMKEMEAMRAEAHANFETAQQKDAESVELLSKAAATLSAYYQKNAALVQKPKADFKSADAHEGESSNIVAILDMMKEDFEKEMKEGQAAEADDVAEHENELATAQKSLDAQEETKVTLEKERAALGRKKTSTDKFKASTNGDLAAAGEVKKALAVECKFLKTTFGTRRKKRKDEMDGLQEASAFLAGVAAGDAVLAPSR